VQLRKEIRQGGPEVKPAKASETKGPITKDEKDALREKGYSVGEILKMTPQEARGKLAEPNQVETEKPKPPSKAPSSGSTAAVASGSGYGTIAASEKNQFAESTNRSRVHGELPKPSALKTALDETLKIAAPATRGEKARATARIVRKNIGQLYHDSVVLSEALKKAHHAFTFMNRDDIYDFIDKMENGQPQKTPQLEQIARQFRELLDGRRDEVQALGKHYLEQFYENYFPHIWKDPDKARNVILQFLTKRRLEGSKSFLKKRTIMTVKEGRKHGLELESENPVDLVLLKLFEMDKFLMAQRIIKDTKARSLIRFFYSRSRVPEDYFKINDRAFTVYLHPEITKKEAYDQILVDQLMDIARSLGVDTQRFVSIGGKRWGYAEWPLGAAQKGPYKVRTKYAGPESVLAHEIGHVLGVKYRLYETLRRVGEGQYKEVGRGPKKGEKVFRPAAGAVEHRKIIDKEWRALADARYKGQEVGPGFAGYVRKAREKEAVMLEALIHAPEEFKKTAPQLYKLFTSFLNENAELRPILDVRSSLVLGQSEAKIPIPGFTVLGHYYAPEPVAAILNNYLSPGLRNSQNLIIAGGYNLMRSGGNILNQAQLALSLFHGINVTTDIMASTLGLSLRQMATPGQRAAGVLRLVTIPTSPIARIWDGLRIKRAYRQQMEDIQDPQLKAMVENIIAADGRDRIDPFYYNQAIKNLTRTLGEIYRGRPAEKIAGVFKLPYETFGAVLETLAKPLMEWYVPTGKIGLFSALAEHEMARAADGQITDEQLHQRLIEAWDSVDNRMGQLIYDNLFWNKIVKDVSMMSCRSVGWNLGSWREYGGAGVDVLNTKRRIERGDVWLSNKMSYAIGAVVLYAVIGAVIMKILTGKGPQQPKDYFFPKTGRQNPDGSDERLSLPTYAKDWFAYGTQPVRTLKNKIHPFWGVITDLAQNKDFFNIQIRNPKDPLSKQILEVVKFVGSEFLPLSARNYQKMQKAEPNQQKKNFWVSLTGITSAPSYITRTPAQKLMYRYIVEEIPDKPITMEQYEIRLYKNNLRNLLRKGAPINAAEARDKLGNKTFEQIVKEAQGEPFAEGFKKLDIYEAFDVYAIANTKEKGSVNQILGEKLENKFYQLSLPTAKPYDIDRMKDYMQMYGIDTQQAEVYLRNYWIRQMIKRKTTPPNLLQGKPGVSKAVKMETLRDNLK
jgi:hypothetical protein